MKAGQNVGGRGKEPDRFTDYQDKALWPHPRESRQEISAFSFEDDSGAH